MRTPNIVHALNSLVPNAEWILEGGKQYSNLVWKDTVISKPTKKQVEDEVARLVAEFETNEYQRNRASEYPAIGDQLDMLWHAIDAGTLNKTSDFYNAIKAVKDANPKSE